MVVPVYIVLEVVVVGELLEEMEIQLVQVVLAVRQLILTVIQLLGHLETLQEFMVQYLNI
jgi:hypothetical protein